MSLLLSPPHPTPELLARLHLHAVLAGFADLLKYAGPAREVLQDRRFCLRLEAGGLSANLVFAQGRCRFLRDFPFSPQVVLRFLSYAQLNKQFTGRGFSLPIPLRGAGSVGHLRAFSKLSAMLQAGLVEKHGLVAFGLTEAAARELHLRLTFSVALAASTILIEKETYARALFEDSGDWVAAFSVAEGSMDAWIARRAGVLAWGRGQPPARQTASLHFDQPGTALNALGGSLDNFAAINAGALQISGLAPLIDKLGLVLERVPAYLTPG